MKRQHASPAGPGRIALCSAVVLIVLLAGCTPSANTSPAVTSPPAATSSPSASPIDTTNWIPYESKRYGLSLKHPRGWIAVPATRDWTLKADAENLLSGGQEGFWAADRDLFVAVWATPAKDTPETLEGVAAWVQQYCEHGGATCIGLDQAVPLCNESDCHSGLLVRFEPGPEFRAFFTGGKHKGQIVGVDVGRPDWHESLVKFGGARRLLEAFLSTMGVCPYRPDQTPPGCPE